MISGVFFFFLQIIVMDPAWLSRLVALPVEPSQSSVKGDHSVEDGRLPAAIAREARRLQVRPEQLSLWSFNGVPADGGIIRAGSASARQFERRLCTLLLRPHGEQLTKREFQECKGKESVRAGVQSLLAMLVALRVCIPIHGLQQVRGAAGAENGILATNLLIPSRVPQGFDADEQVLNPWPPSSTSSTGSISAWGPNSKKQGLEAPEQLEKADQEDLLVEGVQIELSWRNTNANAGGEAASAVNFPPGFMAVALMHMMRALWPVGGRRGGLERPMGQGCQYDLWSHALVFRWPFGGWQLLKLRMDRSRRMILVTAAAMQAERVRRLVECAEGVVKKALGDPIWAKLDKAQVAVQPVCSCCLFAQELRRPPSALEAMRAAAAAAVGGSPTVDELEELDGRRFTVLRPSNEPLPASLAQQAQRIRRALLAARLPEPLLQWYQCSRVRGGEKAFLLVNGHSTARSFARQGGVGGGGRDIDTCIDGEAVQVLVAHTVSQLCGGRLEAVERRLNLDAGSSQELALLGRNKELMAFYQCLCAEVNQGPNFFCVFILPAISEIQFAHVLAFNGIITVSSNLVKATNTTGMVQSSSLRSCDVLLPLLKQLLEPTAQVVNKALEAVGEAQAEAVPAFLGAAAKCAVAALQSLPILGVLVKGAGNVAEFEVLRRKRQVFHRMSRLLQVCCPSPPFAFLLLMASDSPASRLSRAFYRKRAPNKLRSGFPGRFALQWTLGSRNPPSTQPLPGRSPCPAGASWSCSPPAGSARPAPRPPLGSPPSAS